MSAKAPTPTNARKWNFKQGLAETVWSGLYVCIELKKILDHVPMDITKTLDPAKKNAQIIFILIPKVRSKIILLITLF